MAKEKTAKTKPKKNQKSANGILRYFKELRSEVKKVVWPSKKQIRNNTFVVIGFMAIAGVFIWILDFVFSSVVGFVFK